MPKYLEIAQTLESGRCKSPGHLCQYASYGVRFRAAASRHSKYCTSQMPLGKEAKEKKLQALGLLGNRPTMTGDFIPSSFSKENLAYRQSSKTNATSHKIIGMSPMN